MMHPGHHRQQRRRRQRVEAQSDQCGTKSYRSATFDAFWITTVLVLALGKTHGFNHPKGWNCDKQGGRKTGHYNGGFGTAKLNANPTLVCLSMESRGPEKATTILNEQEQTRLAIQGLMVEYDPILLFASKLLPPDKAADASALYAWCRRLDEICDNEDDASGGKNLEPVRENLQVWQTRFEALWSANDGDSYDTQSKDYTKDEYLMDLALKQCIENYQGIGKNDGKSLLTRDPFDDMIEGMKSDAIEGRRIQTLEELEVYAYQVAGTVGLMLLPLLLSDEDYKNDSVCFDRTLLAIETSREPAICLGKAIQLVNILRDATQDAKLGRIYLPQDMLSEQGVDEASILALGIGASSGAAPDGYKKVVKKVSVRAKELLSIAEVGKDTLPAPLGPLFVQIIVELYRDYLDELNRRDYDNLTSNSVDGEDRVKISTLRKVRASLRAVGKVGMEFLGVSGS